MPELQFLARVQRFPGISLQGLADDLGIHKATASARAEQLVEAGLLLRKTNPDSRRAIMLELTPAGLNYYQEAKDFIKTHLIAQMNHFSSDELQTLESGLNLLARMVLHVQPELRDKLSEMET